MKVTISGMQFYIFGREHGFPHVLVVYDGGWVKVRLLDGEPMGGRFPKGREGRVQKIIAEHSAEWTDAFYRLNPHLKR